MLILNGHLLLYSFFEIRLCYKNIYAETSKILVKSSKKKCVLNQGGFLSLITRSFFSKMLNENEVLIQLGMRFQLGALRYSDIIAKEIKT